MESKKKVTGGSSSSSFVDLFGPKDSSMHSSSSTGLFSSVFGPSSTVLFFFLVFSFLNQKYLPPLDLLTLNS